MMTNWELFLLLWSPVSLLVSTLFGRAADLGSEADE